MSANPTDPLFPRQEHLREAPTGIGVQTAWRYRADGSGTTLIDLERGWNLSHEDLPRDIPHLNGVIRPQSIYHGTGVLGIIAGLHDNGRGVAGIAPGATVKVVSDHLSGLTGEEPPMELDALLQETADMVDFVLPQLAFGDVLLIEAMYGGVPAEVDSRIRDRIAEATRRGIIVIEPGGNQGVDLDKYQDVFERRIFNRSEPGDFEDSGAIIVGACSAEQPHVRWHDSHGDTNFGTKIDCHAWGEGIVTTGSVSRPTRNDAYYDGTDIGFEYFGGTSGAAAIIAGVCLLIQSLQTNPGLVSTSGHLGKLSPGDMRNMLRKRENGTEPLFPEDLIGVMPDFDKIIVNEYGVIPFG